MANRFPLIIDVTDKKLKELPIGDNLTIAGDILLQSGSLLGNVVGNVVGNVSGTVTGNLIGNVTGPVTGDITGNITGDVTGNVFSNDSTLLVDGENGTIAGENIVGSVTANIIGNNNQLLVDSVNNTISYSVLSGTPFIPTDVSQLTDNEGIISGSSPTTFLALTDTPSTYGFGSNKFLKVTQDETGIVYGELVQQEIETALGYVPYNGTTNLLGFLTAETDTLDSVVQRGNTTLLSIEVNSVLASSLVSTNINLQSFLEFFDNGQTAQFDISVEAGTALNIANRLSIDTSNDEITISNCELLGVQSSIGNATSYWNNLYSTNTFIENIKNKPSTSITVDADQDVNFFISQNKKVKLTGTGCLQLSKLTTAQRNAFTPEVGDIIYNVDLSTVQIYVGITAWTGDPPVPVPGWISLYTPPDPPTGV